MLKHYLTLVAFILISACTSTHVQVHCAEVVYCLTGFEDVRKQD